MFTRAADLCWRTEKSDAETSKTLRSVSLLADGRVAYLLKKPRRNGATHLDDARAVPGSYRGAPSSTEVSIASLRGCPAHVTFLDAAARGAARLVTGDNWRRQLGPAPVKLRVARGVLLRCRTPPARRQGKKLENVMKSRATFLSLFAAFAAVAACSASPGTVGAPTDAGGADGGDAQPAPMGCASGTVFCNSSCGICLPSGVTCSKDSCGTGGGGEACGDARCGGGTHCTAGACHVQASASDGGGADAGDAGDAGAFGCGMGTSFCNSSCGICLPTGVGCHVDSCGNGSAGEACSGSRCGPGTACIGGACVVSG